MVDESSEGQQDAAVLELEALPDLLTVEEVAGYLRIGRNSAYEGVRRGEIPALKFGVSIRIPKMALRSMLASASAA